MKAGSSSTLASRPRLTFWVLLAYAQFNFSEAASCPPTNSGTAACTPTVDYESQNYTMIPAGYGCSQYGVANVESITECYDHARMQLWHQPYQLLNPAESGVPWPGAPATVGTDQPRLSNNFPLPGMSIDLGFIGCTYLQGSGAFFFSWDPDGNSDSPDLGRRILCRGIATSTTTTTVTSTTETATATTVTATYSTSATRTVTSSTSVTQTTETSTVTATTATATLTETQTTSATQTSTATVTNTTTSIITITSTSTATTETQTVTSTFLRFQLRDARAKFYTFGVGTAKDQTPEYMEIFIDRAGGEISTLSGANQIICTSSVQITAGPGSLTVTRDGTASLASAEVVTYGVGQEIRISLNAPIGPAVSTTFRLTYVSADGDQPFIAQPVGTARFQVKTPREDVPVTSEQVIREYTIYSARVVLRTQGQETERDSAPEEMELEVNRQDAAPFPINGPGAIIVRTTLEFVSNGTMMVEGNDVPGATCEVLFEPTGHVVFNITLAQRVDPFATIWMLLKSSGGSDSEAQFLPIPTAGAAIFQVTTSQDPGVFDAIFNVALPPSAASDPITFYNGRKIKFWLPVGEMMPLLETPDLHLLASVMQGPEQDQQWFDHFVMTLPNGTAFADVQVAKRFSQNQNKSSFTTRRGGRISQLDIRLGNEEGQLEHVDLAMGSFFAAGEAIRIGIGERAFHPPRVHGLPVMQYLHVEAPSAAFIIMASHAGNEFPNDYELQAKYAHLDWICLDLVNVASFSGILPELWGVQPQSEQVAAMTVPPSLARCDAGVVCPQMQAMRILPTAMP